MNAPADDAPFDEFTGPGAGVAATLYDPDGASHPRPATLIYGNLRFIEMFGTNRGNILGALFPSTTPIQSGGVLTVTATGTWYLLVKVSDMAVPLLFTPGNSAALIALPYALMVARTVGAATPMRRNGYGEPYGPGDTTTTTRTVRMGDSNGNDPLTGEDIGALPRGITTLYCPLQADVVQGDTVTLSDGSQGTVQQRNPLDADGALYGLQLLVDQI